MKAGLEGIVAAETRISHVDGLAGELIIGGYPLEEIAGRISYEEVACLLWNLGMHNRGELPNSEQLKELAEQRSIPDAALSVIRAGKAAPPMDVLRMTVAMLSLDDPAVQDESMPANLRRAKVLTSRIPTIIAAHDRVRKGLEPISPDPGLNRAANFLYMLNGKRPSNDVAHAVDTYWTTVIDHGMNASTFTARVIASTQSDMYSAVTGAIGALKGPLHGGAPGPVLDMLLEIKSVDQAEPWVRNKVQSGGRIMGFGHRIYKVRDPRADVLKEAARKLNQSGAGNEQLFDLATGVEKVILQVLDELKPGRNLKTNVEFYTALVLQSAGLTPDQFSPLFAAGRIAGWTAHVLEQLANNRLIRPASEYIGERITTKARRHEESQK
jgi:citrate synthase